jgi:uncharacterized protein
MTKINILSNPFIKILIYSVIIISVYFGYQILLYPFAKQVDLVPRRLLVNPLLDIGLGVILYYLFKFLWQKLESAPFDLFSTKNIVADLKKAILFMLVFCGIVYGILFFNGNLLFTQGDGFIVLLEILITAFLTAFAEELFFRGILFRLMEQYLGSIYAIIICSLLFGLAHLFNPNATLVGAIAIGMQAGIALNALFVLKRNLWLPIFLHMLWNFSQTFLGVQLSGTATTKSFFRSILNGPEWLTGGEFGIEFSIIVIILGVSVGLYLLYKTYKEQKIIAPIWKR